MAPFFVPQIFTHTIDNSTKSEDELAEEPTVEYQLNYVQRVFIVLEHHNSCTLATIILSIMALSIILNVLVFVLASVPRFQSAPTTCRNPACHDQIYCPNSVICEPQPFNSLLYIDAATIVIFSADYFLRLLTCWTVSPRLAGLTDDPHSTTSKPSIFLRYLFKFHSIIDFVAILPFYIALAQLSCLENMSTGFLRILRIPRLLQYIVNGDGVSTMSALISILFRCLKRSMNVLLFTLYFYGIGIILFSTVILALEGGNFTVNTDYPLGAYLRDDATRTGLEKSIFTSIPISMYFTVVTTTTLGYGDFTCQTTGGRAVACLLCFAGVIVLALPIAIIGSNFFDFYCAYLEKVKNQNRQREEEKTRLKLSFAAESINKMRISLKHEVNCSRLANSTAQLSRMSAAQDATVKRALRLLQILKARPVHREQVSFDSGDSQEDIMVETDTEETADPLDEPIRFTPFEPLECQSSEVSQKDDSLWREEELELHVSVVTPYLPRGQSTVGKRRKRQFLPNRLKKKLPQSWTTPRDYDFPWFVQSEYVLRDEGDDAVYKERTYDVSFPGRLFLLFHSTDSCKLAVMLAWCNIIIILLGVVALIAQSVDSFTYTPLTCKSPACENNPTLCPGRTICAPIPIPGLKTVNEVVVLIFTIDYVMRLSLSGAVSARLAGLVPSDWDEREGILSEKEKRSPSKDPPPLAWYYQMWLYSTKFYSVVDLISIFPYYFSFFLPTPSLIFFRIMRLTRIVGLLKVPKSREYADLVKKTIKLSSSILMNLIFYVIILMVLFGCLIYVVEVGEFQVSLDYPNGAFLRPDVGGLSSSPSPFRSISDGIYFVVITATTMGYGDLYPTTQVGRFFSCVFVYAGILVSAFPIAVIGKNFVSEYTKLNQKNISKNEERKNIIIRKDNSIPASITGDMILLESRMLLKTLLSESCHLSKSASELDSEAKKVSRFATLLKLVASPPGDWD